MKRLNISLGDAARLFHLDMVGDAALVAGRPERLLCEHCQGRGCLICNSTGIDPLAHLSPAARRVKELTDAIRRSW